MLFKNDLIQSGRKLTYRDISLVQPAHHIKKGRSAYELWEKIFENGPPEIPREILAQLGIHPLFNSFIPDESIPELNSQFDNYGKGRQHDLFTSGNCKSGRLAIGVEAKVDEPFDNNTAAQYRAAGKALKHSLKPKRIDDLINALFAVHRQADAENLRYQLIQATAGVLAEAKLRNADNALFVIYNLVAETKSPLYTIKNTQNTRDLDAFISVFSDGKYASLPLNHIIGPLTVKGNSYIPGNIPLYFLKVEGVFK